MPAIVITFSNINVKGSLILSCLTYLSGWECHFVGYRQFSIICCYMVVYQKQNRCHVDIWEKNCMWQTHYHTVYYIWMVVVMYSSNLVIFLAILYPFGKAISLAEIHECREIHTTLLILVSMIPSGNLLHSYWTWPIYSEFSHETWWFSSSLC